jgi:hypothetical protein
VNTDPNSNELRAAEAVASLKVQLNVLVQEVSSVLDRIENAAARLLEEANHGPE